MSVSLSTIRAAQQRIASYVTASPVIPMTPTGLLLKAESLHPTGSFKVRGAFNAMLQLDAAQRRAGVVAHSSGNHAQAVAYAAHRLGIAATIVMPCDAPAIKRDKTVAWGATVIEVGPASAERAARAAELVEARGLTMIEPHDSLLVVAATGTILLELVEQVGDIGRVFVPLGGGGLAAGLAAAKTAAPGLRLIGVEPDLAADAIASVRAGKLIALPPELMSRTSADGVRVGELGHLTWPYIRDHFDDFVTVSEAEIASAMARVADEARLVAEPSGALAIAGALKLGGGSRDVAILSGANVDRLRYLDMLAEGGR